VPQDLRDERERMLLAAARAAEQQELEVGPQAGARLYRRAIRAAPTISAAATAKIGCGEYDRARMKRASSPILPGGSSSWVGSLVLSRGRSARRRILSKSAGASSAAAASS